MAETKTVTKLQVHPYRCVLNFTESRYVFERRTGTRIPEDAAGCAFQIRSGVFWVYAGTVSDLVHECTHVALDVLERSRINTDSSDGEVLAYLVQNLTERVLERHSSILCKLR